MANKFTAFALQTSLTVDQRLAISLHFDGFSWPDFFAIFAAVTTILVYILGETWRAGKGPLQNAIRTEGHM